MEIQNILQIEERTFYRYMARIYKIDQALFAEQEKDAIRTEIRMFKDRMLKTYRWFMSMADDENMHPNIRIAAQRNAIMMAQNVVWLELEGPEFIHDETLLKRLHH